jgi:hypothetical protein
VRRVADRRWGERRTGIAAIFARVGLWLAAFALLSQSLAVAAPPMFEPEDAGSVAAQLSALLGQGVVVCSQADEPGAPHRPYDCHDQCPLCRVVADASILSLPSTEPLPAPPLLATGRIEIIPQPRRIRSPPPGFSFARGPPSQT